MLKEVVLKDGTGLTVKRMVLDDLDKLMDFYSTLPPSDRKYLRIDVTDRKAVKKRMEDAEKANEIRLVVLKGDKVIARGGLELAHDDWRKHQAELRLIVARDYQRKGVGLMLARELYYQAVENGVKTLVAKMMKPQTGAKNLVTKLGFHQEAVIPDYVEDQFGRLQDLIIMTCDMESFWKELEQTYKDTDWSRCR